MRTAYLVLTIGFALVGCSAHYEVTRVTYPAGLTPTRPGIVYALPKTEFVVDVPIRRREQATGRYSGDGIWDKCVQQCIGPNVPANRTCDVGADTKDTLFCHRRCNSDPLAPK
jgi:hypothetical protein